MNMFIMLTEITSGSSFGSSGSTQRLLVPKPSIQLVKELPEGAEVTISGGIGTARVKESFDEIWGELCAR